MRTRNRAREERGMSLETPNSKKIDAHQPHNAQKITNKGRPSVTKPRCQTTIATQMDQSDGPTTRSAKRRRVSVPITSRYTSPDELAGSPEHSSNHTQQRTSSNSYHNTPDRQPRHPSYSRARSGGSPDELDHTRFHTFYRASSFSKSVQPLLHIEPAVTPEYSRISTPIATPEPALFLAPPLAKYVPYKEKMVLRGHRRGVAAVRFSPDGRLIASCCKLFCGLCCHLQL